MLCRVRVVALTLPLTRTRALGCRLHGCYEAIDGGLLADSLSDLTGGCCESYNLALMRNEGLPQNLQTASSQQAAQQARPVMQQLYEFLARVLLDAFDKDSVICCGIDAREEAQTRVNTRGFSNQVLANGLVCSHAYSVTSVNRVRVRSLCSILHCLPFHLPFPLPLPSHTGND